MFWPIVIHLYQEPRSALSMSDYCLFRLRKHFHHRGNRAMSTGEGRRRRSLRPRRRFQLSTKHAAETLVDESHSKIVGPPSPPTGAKPIAPVRKKAVAAKPKATLPSKTRAAARRPKPSSPTASAAEKLVCRYCGSDDLAPSFKKRRDARCRTCFKKRYASAAHSKGTRTQRAKVAK